MITEVDILDEARENFLTYSEEVLTDRAIPAAEDGLLSAQRKLLWTMEDYLGMNSKSKTKKCNAIVGSTLATSYFHGDQACYGVLRKMSQEFLMRYPLVKGQGQLGTQENNDMFSSSRYCVTGDTLIPTSKGTIPIEDIVPNTELSSEHDIDIWVKGYNNESLHASKLFNSGLYPVYRITLQNGQWIQCTGNHPLMILDNQLNYNWKLTDKLQIGDKLLLSACENNECFGSNNDLLEAKMLGSMVSEGYATTQNRIGINNTDLDMIIPVQEFFQREIPSSKAQVQENTSRHYYEYCIADKNYYDTFVSRYEFQKSDKKHLPKCFFEGTKEYQATCLSYLFEGDGCASQTNTHNDIVYSSISEQLIHQLQIILLQNFGIFSYIKRSKTRNEIKLQISGKGLIQFQEQINFISERKKQTLQQAIKVYQNRKQIGGNSYYNIFSINDYVRHYGSGTVAEKRQISFSNEDTYQRSKKFVSDEMFTHIETLINNYLEIKIISIEEIGVQPVYSLKIDDESHAYMGNGFINHNTEAKPNIYTDLMFNDFKKQVVPMKETYNGEFMEPVMLPSLFPNAICNGRQAIGISMAHCSAPHNLTEVCNALIAMITKGSMTVDELLSYIPGPDFPLGGKVLNIKDVREAFATGKSKVSLKIQGDYEIEGQKIIFTTIPYRTYRNKIKEQIQKNIDTFSEVLDDFDDESNIGQNRLIFYVKKGVDVNKALLKLFLLTDLQSSISYNMNYIVNGTPKLCSMIDLLQAYIHHQEDVLIKATEFDKEKAEARAHILRGLIAAVDQIDRVIELIKQSESKNEARSKLIDFLTIDELQANAILDMKLGKLTRIDKEELVNELAEKEKFIARCIELLTSQDARNNELIRKITELRDTYGDARRTQLLNVDTSKAEKEESVIIPQECVVVVNQKGMVKRVPKRAFKPQKRATAGVKTSDMVVFTTATNTLDYLMVFTNNGKMRRWSVGDIPEGTNVSAGVPLSLLMDFNEDEVPIAFTTMTRDTAKQYIFFATKKGMVKKVPLSEYDRMKRNGIIAITIKEGDELAAATFIDQEDMMLFTKNGMCIRFTASSMPISSRTAQGVKGMNVAENDEIIAALPISDPAQYLAVVGENGLGKLIELKEFSVQNRGGKGVIYHKSAVAGVAFVNKEDSLLISGDKTSIVIKVEEMPLLGKIAAGNIMLKNNDKVNSVAKI